jgi:hypothetical protein
LDGGVKFCAGCGNAVSGIILGGKSKLGRGRPTTFEFKAEILSDLWLNYRYEPKFVDFVAYNDLGLPLAHAISEGIVSSSPQAVEFIDESYKQLLELLDKEDSGFESVEEILGSS